ncbi:aminotransferase class I/II-fold pyridoxal phosphate-dependent enzyme [Cylindrospermopsis raciborskii CHAB3438]|uniref:DegT/DnrJ/EryC1/StrS family aminotransferase n=1 Tax=Cylindrospermopsis raciborskii TaxID=77022 RepID=UPI000B614683|nr:DegT/DnrJ/EryC1/StrS family aminotransferase [Cylindrospermopsis raciborskii]MCH4903869.1 aminotransferase class I/II-fold pyridoxal phosphate-dependent enzyme [Cylindrospermopsis raciborskii CHAB3438]BAZ91353.1 DegT/DnrJ/EryC1/StrS aminotransferase [Raphidiopsis curvata NIES-932]
MLSITPSLIKLSKSCLSDAEKQAVMAVLDREFLGMGQEVNLFEQELTGFLGRPVACVVNGTAALHLALQACGIGRGDEVLVQSLTYVASFQSITATGATPVPCDVDPETLTLDWRDAEKRITPRTKAVMPVHYSGGVGKLDEIYDFAKSCRLRVIEDAAHAFGTKYRGQLVGSFGDVTCFSFDGIKNITSGEGGCIVSNDEEVMSRVRDARLLGVEKDTERRFEGQRSWDFNVTAQGWRYHMSDIMAAIGRVQLQRFTELAKKRQSLARLYDRKLNALSSVRPLVHNYEEVVPHIYPIRLASESSRVSLRQDLLNFGIQTGLHYQPNHYLSLFSPSPNYELPVTDKVYPTLMTLPLHPDLSKEQIDLICDKLSRY